MEEVKQQLIELIKSCNDNAKLAIILQFAAGLIKPPKTKRK